MKLHVVVSSKLDEDILNSFIRAFHNVRVFPLWLVKKWCNKKPI